MTCTNCFNCQNCYEEQVGCSNCFDCQNCYNEESGDCSQCYNCENCYNEENSNCKFCYECEKCYSGETGCTNCYECQVNYTPSEQEQSQRRQQPRQRRPQAPRDGKIPIQGRRAAIPLSKTPSQQNIGPSGRVGNVTVFATERCNLACDYCFVYEIWKKKGIDMRKQGEDMTIETAKQTVDFLLNNPPIRRKEEKPPSRHSFHWFGGEPTLLTDLINDTWEYGQETARQQNKQIRWGMTTNGVALAQEDNAQWIIDHQPFHVLFSIDGWGESNNVHRKFHNGEGSWNYVEKALGNLNGKIPPNELEIRWTVSPENSKYIVPSLKEFLKNDIRNLALDPVHEVEWTEEDFDFYYKQLDEATMIALDEFREGRFVHMKPLRDGLRFLASPVSMRSNFRCGLGLGSVGIAPSGDILGCHRWFGRPGDDHIIGHVKTGIDVNKAQKFWDKFDITKLRSEVDGACKNCPVKDGCFGACLVVNFDQTEDMNIMPYESCEHERRKLLLATKAYCIMRAEKNETFFKGYKIPIPWQQSQQQGQGQQCTLQQRGRYQR